MKLSFLIVNYFSAEYTIKCVKSILKYIHFADYEILIVDNSVSENEKLHLDSLKDNRVYVYYADKNLGFVKGNNFLAEKAKGEMLVLINPDCYLIDDSIKLLVEKSAEENIGVVGPKLLNEDDSYQISFYKLPELWTVIKEHIFLNKKAYVYKTDHNVAQNCEVIKGACMVIKKELFNNVNRFDDSFFMYSEEVDLCKRLISYDKINIYNPACTIYHFGKKSTSSDRAKEFSLFHYHKSKLVYFKKHKQKTYFIYKFILMFSLIERAVLLKIFSTNCHSSIYFSSFKKLLRE